MNSNSLRLGKHHKDAVGGGCFPEPWAGAGCVDPVLSITRARLGSDLVLSAWPALLGASSGEIKVEENKRQWAQCAVERSREGGGRVMRRRESVSVPYP